MRASRVSNERGVALALAVFALVVIGALVAGIFFAGRLEQQSGQNAVYAGQANEAAEAGIGRTVTGLSSATLQAMPVDPTQTTSYAATTSFGATGAHATYSTTVRRLTDNVWLVESLGKRTDKAGTELARRSLGQLIELNVINLPVSAGLTAIGRVTLSGNSTVSGYDQTPPGWSAAGVSCPPLDSVSGVRYNGTLTQQGSATLNGDPARNNDNTLNSSNIFGTNSFDQLKAMATLILTSDISGLAPATTGSPARCNTSVENNWGAPEDATNACFNYFPIVYHNGDLSISGTGSGQGILLVEGNLNVQGRIDFYGPVIVTGGVNIRGTGSDDVKFYGGVMAQDVTLDDSRLTGNATVNYSSCAIKRALQGSAKPIALNERSWVQLYQ